jgi:transposase
MEFDNHYSDAPGGQPLKPDKPGRRKWSDDEKRSIVEECSKPGMSVSAVSRKHRVPTNQLFQWRKQFETGVLTLHNGGGASPLSECRDILNRITRLKRLENMVIDRLAEELRRGQITAYNASITLSNVTGGLSKLSALAFDLFDRFERIEPESSRTADTDDDDCGLTLEEERECEAWCLDLVRHELARKAAIAAGQDYPDDRSESED